MKTTFKLKTYTLIISLFFLAFLFSACSKENESTNHGKINYPKTLMAIGSKSVILYSNDTGKTWLRGEVPNNAKMVYDKQAKLNDITYFKSAWYAVGGYSHFNVHGTVLLKSIDNGATWEKISVPTNKELYCIKTDGKILTAVGYGGTIIKTSNGETWEAIDMNQFRQYDKENEKQYFKDIAIINNKIVVIGNTSYTVSGFTTNYPIAIESNDLGTTWKEIKTPRYTGMYKNIIKRGEELFVIGDGPILAYKNSEWNYDNRNGKIKVFPPYTIANNKIYATAENTGSAVKFFCEYDGNEWIEKKNMFFNLSVYGLAYGQEKFVFAGHENQILGDRNDWAALYTSTDNCANWEVARESLGEELKDSKSAFIDIVFSADNFIVLGDPDYYDTANSIIYTSTDAKTWIKSDLPSLEKGEKITKILAL